MCRLDTLKVVEFGEVESGKRFDQPQFTAELAACRTSNAEVLCVISYG